MYVARSVVVFPRALRSSVEPARFGSPALLRRADQIARVVLVAAAYPLARGASARGDGGDPRGRTAAAPPRTGAARSAAPRGGALTARSPNPILGGTATSLRPPARMPAMASSGPPARPGRTPSVNAERGAARVGVFKLAAVRSRADEVRDDEVAVPARGAGPRETSQDTPVASGDDVSFAGVLAGCDARGLSGAPGRPSARRAPSPRRQEARVRDADLPVRVPDQTRARPGRARGRRGAREGEGARAVEVAAKREARRGGVGVRRRLPGGRSRRGRKRARARRPRAREGAEPSAAAIVDARENADAAERALARARSARHACLLLASRAPRRDVATRPSTDCRPAARGYAPSQSSSLRPKGLRTPALCRTLPRARDRRDDDAGPDGDHARCARAASVSRAARSGAASPADSLSPRTRSVRLSAARWRPGDGTDDEPARTPRRNRRRSSSTPWTPRRSSAAGTRVGR